MNVFQRIRNLAKMEERQRWAVEHQMARCARLSPVLSDMPKGGGGSGQRMEEDVILLTILKDQHEKTLAELKTERGTIAPGIRALKDGNQRTAMTLRYMKNMRITEIGNTMGYSERQVFRILERAETKVQQRLERKTPAKKDVSTCQ